jgi:hypothetical protein
MRRSGDNGGLTFLWPRVHLSRFAANKIAFTVFIAARRAQKTANIAFANQR